MAVDARAQELIAVGNRMFSARQPLLSLWQEIAELFYVERADFTRELVIGEDLAGHLMNSYTNLLRRELGNQISAMLRPRDSQWFRLTTEDEDRDQDTLNARYLEYVAMKLKRGMYHPESQLIKTTKMSDHDFVTFGQAVLSVEESADRVHPFYRAFHLKNCAWMENAKGRIDCLHRDDQMSARVMRERFGEKVLHQSVKNACKKNPEQKFKVRCIVMPTDEYDYVGPNGKRGGKKLPFTIVYIDVENLKILREGYLPDFPYVVPRWHTVTGSVYAYSPASIVALPDGRMAQEMARIILESGEKTVDPPMVAVEEAVREINIAAGAITWVDLAMDGKLQDAVKPIPIQNNMDVAFALQADLREMLSKAWFIDKLNLPQPERDMTAYETARRLEEYVRNLLPLFEPIEIEYNTALLDKSFGVMRNMGHFPASEVPQDLSGADVSWAFESPLQTSGERVKVERFGEVLQLIGAATQMGVQSMPVDLDMALRDAIIGTQAPSNWIRPVEEMEQEAAQTAETQQLMQGMQEIQGGALVAKDVAEAANAMEEASVPAAMRGRGAQPALPPPSGA